MAKPAKLRIKEKMTEKEQAIEKFTDILNAFHDNGSTIEDFKCKFSAWSKAFISENKLNESLKSQAILHLKLSRISRLLITAIVSVCILETYTKFQKSFAYLGLTLYLSVIAMNLVSTIIIAYRNSQNEYILEVNQYFVNVYAMFQIFKLRLDVLRRRCNWDVKSDSVPSGVEPEYSNQDTDYGRLYSSAFHLYNIYGIAVGCIIFLLCFYLEFEIFASLEVFTICLLFAIAIAKDIKFHKLHGRLQKSTKFMRNVTIEFLTWFENDCEICKILQQHQVSNTVTNLFLTKTLNICRKPQYLNFAISITACKVFRGLDVSRNDFKNALLFLAYGKYFILDKLTVKTINTQVVKQPCKEKTAKEKYKLSCSHALARNLDHSREIPERAEINRCRVADDNIKQMYSENKSNAHFANEDSEIDSRHLNKKGTSTPPKYTGKASKVYFSKNEAFESFKHKSKERSFDENLPLRYELREIEPEEEAVSASGIDFSDLDEMELESNCSCKILLEYKGGIPVSRFLFCKSCLDIINSDSVLSPISTKELCQNKVDLCDLCEKSYSNVEEISKKSIRSGTFDGEDIREESFILCRRCFPIVYSNLTRYAMSENELCQAKEETCESVPKHLTKASEGYCNTDGLFISEHKDTDLKTNGYKTNETASINFNKSVVISDDGHSCESTSSIPTAETAKFNELVPSDFHEINDSNLHEQRLNEIKFKDESETVHKDVSLNLNVNKTVKINVKGFTTDDACLSERASDHTLDETKNDIHENEMLERQSNVGINSDKQERITQNNSTDKTNKSFLSDHSQQFQGICTNLTEKSETRSNNNKRFENSFSGNSEFDSDKQNKNNFTGEYNETQIPCDEINYERHMNNLAYDKENYPSGSNSFENEIGDSGFFEPGGNETKSDIEYRIIEEDKIEDKHKYAPAEVTDNVRVTSNTIEKIDVHSNKNETSEKIFSENRKSYLHKQKLSETKLMDMDARNITTKKIVVDNISNNPNTNTDKDILNQDVFISENDSMFFKNDLENYLDKNEMLKDTSYFNRQSTIEAESNDEFYIHESTTTDNSSCYPVDSGFINVNQNIESRTAISSMELSINRTGEIDTSSNFKDVCENQNEQETEKREKNVDKNIDSMINEDISNEFLSKVNVEESQNDKIDKGGKACNQRKNSKNQHNRKRSQKKRHFKSRNKETIDRFTDKITDSASKLDHPSDSMEAFPNEATHLERKELMPNGSKNFSLLNETDKTSIGIVDETSEEMKHLNVTKTFEEVQDSSLQEDFYELVTDLNNHDKIDTASEIYQDSLILNQEDRDKQNDSVTNADCYFYAQNVADEANYPELNFSLSQEIDSPVSDKELAWTKIEQENVKQEIGSEHKSITMERPYCETNNKIEITNTDNIKSIVATPSCAIEPLKNDDKCIISTNEMVHNKNELTNIPKSGDIILHSTNTAALSESEKIASTENIATDNSRSKSCLTDTSSRIIKKGKRRIREKIKNEEQTNFVSLESSAGSGFKAKTSTEEENSNRLIVDKEQTNCVSSVSSAGSVLNAKTSTEEENSNILIVDKRQINCNKEQANCVSLESSAGSGFNAKTSTEEENGNRLIVDKEQADSVSLESSAGGIFNAKTSTEEENRRRLIVDKEHTNSISLVLSAGSVLNAKTSTEEENNNRLILDKRQIIYNKEQANCVSFESSAGSGFNAKTSTGEENGNRLIVDKEQANPVSLESSAGGIFNAKTSTEEENSNRLIVDKRQVICNEEQTNCVSLESSAESVYNPKVNTKEENSDSTVIVNIHSLNERKIQLAEQLPLEYGDTESEISFSEKCSCQKLTENDHRIKSLRNINDEVQNRSNESPTNTAEISNSNRSHRTRYPANINDEVGNKITETDTDTVGTSNSFIYKENKITDKGTTNPEIDHNQLDTEEQLFPTVASNIENDVKISKANEIIRTRNTLTRLWKNEKKKMFNIEYRNIVNRKIIHLEKELRTNGQSCARKLSVVDVKENKFAFQTADGDEHFSSDLEVTCKYPDDECEEIHDKRIRSWVHSVTTENSSEISQKGLNESKTPPTGSSEDSNFHFHQSTSPSDTSWDASEESGDTYGRHRSSACFSTNQESFECFEINKDKNTSLEKRVNRIVDSSDAEISKTRGSIKWVTMSSGGKPYKIPNSQPMISSSTSDELEQATSNSKSNEITRENRYKISAIDNESELIFQKSGKFSYSADACSTKKHLDSMSSDVQLDSETFEALTYNYDAKQNNSPKTNQTDPLKYHLIYKNLELHVLDSSPSLTIRLVDENDDSDAALTPRWRRFVNNSLSSSNSSVVELQLPSEMSSSSSGETVKENINISEGKLKMLVGKSDYEEASVSSDSYENLINKNSMENTAVVNVIKDSGILINSENSDKVSQNKENRSIASEFHESEKFVNKHALNESIIDNNDVPSGYNETVMKETGLVRTCSFENTDIRDNGNLIGNKSADKVREEKNKKDQSAMYEFRESGRITNKNIINESFVDNNDVPDGNIESLVKETEVAICSAENIDVSNNGNLIDIENSDKVTQHKNTGDQSAMFEFEETEHFGNKHPISESVEIGDHVLGRNTETVVKETKVLAGASFDKDCDEVSDIRDNDNLIDSESAGKVNQPKNKGDRMAMYEFHESENFANKHIIHKSSLGNNDVPVVNIETVVKESGVIASCSSGNIASEQYSVGNEISKTDANNVTDKNINEPVTDDSHVPGGNTETIVKKTEVVSSCSFQKNHNNSAGQYPVGNEISDADANNVSDTNVNPVGISENVSVDTETVVTTENIFSKDFQFETNGIKLTCKPRSESDSVEVKFRKLEDKTKLTFKSGYKKLYLKMSSKT